MSDPVQERFQRKVLKADIAGYRRQIDERRSTIKVIEAQISTLEEYERQAEAQLAAMGGDDDD